MSAPLNVLLMREGAYWVAQCLQFDIAVQGKTLAEAQYLFGQTIAARLLVGREMGIEALCTLPAAHPHYWSLWREALRVEATSEPTFRLDAPGSVTTDAPQCEMRIDKAA